MIGLLCMLMLAGFYSVMYYFFVNLLIRCIYLFIIKFCVTGAVHGDTSTYTCIFPFLFNNTSSTTVPFPDTIL